ncbi:MAG: flagellar hook-length control protein FliK [Candidatus Neomarinimicrobiota bacterium]
MKNETVGLFRSGEVRGEDSPAPQAAIPASPAPTAHTEPASLATLARQTVIHYGRYVSGEQRNSVFAFDGGSLGKVQITFQENHAGTTLHIVVDSPEARQMLQRALPNLEQQWAQEGLDFSDVDVTVEDSGGDDAFSDEGSTARRSTESSEAMDDIVNEGIESSGVRYYGYNTVEFVA